MKELGSKVGSSSKRMKGLGSKVGSSSKRMKGLGSKVGYFKLSLSFDQYLNTPWLFS